jgi:hypothetical protein
MLLAGHLDDLAIEMPRPDAAPGGILLGTQPVKDVSDDTAQSIGDGPPISHRLVGAFFPMPG